MREDHANALSPTSIDVSFGKSIPHSSFIELTLKHYMMAVEEDIAAKSEGS